MNNSTISSTPVVTGGGERAEVAAAKVSRIQEKIAVAQLANELAHQLNNPLEALTNLVYLARGAAIKQEVKTWLDDAETQLARISTLVQTILALEHHPHEQRLHKASQLLDAESFRRLKEQYESALHMASIIEGAHDAIYSKKLDGTIMAWNPEAERLFGYSTAEVLGKSVRLLIPPEFRAEERAMLEKIKAGARVEHYDTQRKTKDGRLIRVSVAISPIRDTRGRVTGASTIARGVPPEHPNQPSGPET